MERAFEIQNLGLLTDSLPKIEDILQSDTVTPPRLSLQAHFRAPAFGMRIARIISDKAN
jgi:hypothetical protein